MRVELVHDKGSLKLQASGKQTGYQSSFAPPLIFESFRLFVWFVFSLSFTTPYSIVNMMLSEVFWKRLKLALRMQTSSRSFDSWTMLECAGDGR
jgi:hypothetical protein